MRRLTIALAVLALCATSVAAQARELPLRMLGGRCGEATHGPPRAPATLRASASTRGVVTISLSHFPFYCAPSPRFDARMRDDGTIVLTAREPEPPVARCTCPHSVRLRISSVAPGVHPIEVRFRDDVLATGEVTVDRSARPGGPGRKRAWRADGKDRSGRADRSQRQRQVGATWPSEPVEMYASAT
ncbi:MAG: hypothetical protein M3Y87_27430 [Myxococcota bacterium]|nr:hypothetical protein [Myxococcota bacterium]